MGQGIYVIPKNDKVFSKVLPSIEKLEEALAKKEHFKIKPSGQYALNKVGLSTQVPMRLIFLTSGNAKKIVFVKTQLSSNLQLLKNLR